MNLAASVVDKVQSEVLVVTIVEILCKLKDVMKSKLSRRIKIFGFKRAKDYAKIGVQWGNYIASKLASDLKYITYLTILDMHKP